MHNEWPIGYHLRREPGWVERERNPISINYLQRKHCIYSCSVTELRWESSINFFAHRCMSQRGHVLMKKMALGSLYGRGTDGA